MKRALIATLAGLSLLSSVVVAQDSGAPLPAPNGRVILTISGDITRTNGDGIARFDREMLLRLGTHTLSTTTNWTDGVQEFEGVLASEVMAAVGATGSLITATALNDYVVEIPASDFEQYGVLFAMWMNGRELTRRDRGPIWPVYPRDDYPELQNRDSDKKWIYLLSHMEVHNGE